MGNPLRDRRTPSELAESGQVIEFAEKLGEFKRLAGIVEGDLESLDPDKLPSDWRGSLVSGRLSFGFADAQGGLPMCDAEATATVDVVCQRCLDAMRLPLSVELKLLFAGNESTAEDDDGFESWELDDDFLRPIDLVEEALIMAMPLAAMHVDSDACREPESRQPEASETIRPFAALRAQMDKEN